MLLRLLQLNMYMGKYMGNLIPYLKKERFDILSFQEVSGGEVSFTRKNTFHQICELGYDGQLLVTWRLKDKPTSFFGQAIYFRNGFTLLQKTDVWLKPYRDINSMKTFDPREFPKAVLSVKLEKDGKKFFIISAHLAWSPQADDTKEKMRQGKLFRDYLESLHLPFILTGDFNLSPHTKIVNLISKKLHNLTKEYQITNTINPRTHRHRDKIFPKGIAVDYVITSPEVGVK